MPRSSRWVTLRHAGSLVAAAIVVASSPRAAAAQSLADLAAWDALVVTPVGALPPRARIFHGAAREELAIRYGRWRYDVDDAIHNDFGVTVAHDVDLLHSGVALTAAYLSLSCGTCDAWLTAGAEIQSELVSVHLHGDSTSETTGAAGVRVNAGAARFLGDGHATALSMAGSVQLGVNVPLRGATQLGLALMPGLGFGRLSSVDETASGVRPIFGAAAAVALGHGLVIDLGLQRIYIEGGPTQFGAGMAWRFNGLGRR